MQQYFINTMVTSGASESQAERVLNKIMSQMTAAEAKNPGDAQKAQIIKDINECGGPDPNPRP